MAMSLRLPRICSGCALMKIRYNTGPADPMFVAVLVKRRQVAAFCFGLDALQATFLPYTHRLKYVRRSSSATLPKPYYVTTPIFYPNASPHIGHLYSLVIGDVFARYQRLRRGLKSDASSDEGVMFLAGTDEHGMKIQKAAKAYFGAGGREQEFCDSLTERFRGLGRKANLTNTCFMRTTSEEHKRAVEDVWRKLVSKNYIYKGHYSGWYSVTDECFYSDSQVTPVTAPPSSSESPLSTLTPRPEMMAIETGSLVEWSEEENYMFRLSAFRDHLLQYYSVHPISVYPEQYREEILTMLDDDDSPNKMLADISISRPRTRLEWGIPVPADSSQTIYVWFDALLIYLTGSGYPWWPPSEFGQSPKMECRDGWPPDLQVIGKDILRFHAVYLPAILLALSAASPHGTTAASADLNNNTAPAVSLPFSRTILAHAHWTSSQKKMSKSLGNVADPLDAIDRWGVDVVRFYLMRVGGRWRDDVDWSSLQLEKHQREIHAQLGNYFLRIASPRLATRVASGLQSGDVTFDACFPHERYIVNEGVDVEHSSSMDAATEANYELLKSILALSEKVHGHMETFEAGLALGEIMAVLKLANKSFSEIAPWAPDKSLHVIHTTRIIALETVSIVGACLEPFVPTASAKLREALGVDCQVLRKGPKMSENQAWRRGSATELWDRWTGREVEAVRLF